MLHGGYPTLLADGLMVVKDPVSPVTSTHLHNLGIGSRKDWKKASPEPRGYIEGEQEEPQATTLKSHLSARNVIVLTRLQQTQIFRMPHRYSDNKSTKAPKLKYLFICEVGFILLLLWCQIQDLLL